MRSPRPVTTIAEPITKPEMMSHTAEDAKPENTSAGGASPDTSVIANRMRLAT